MITSAAKKHLSKSEPVMSRLVRTLNVDRYQIKPQHFRTLISSVIGQQLSTKAAATIRERFCRVLGSKAFNHKHILEASFDELRAAGLSGSKVRFVKGLAAAAEAKELDFKKIVKMSDEEVIAALTKHKGVGRWTAEMFLIFSLGRPDILSLGDGGLQSAIKKLYGIKSLTPNKMQKIGEQWKPFRSYASLYLWASLDNEPKKK